MKPPMRIKKIDKIIHDLIGVDYKNCSPAWKAVREQIKGDEKTRRMSVERLKQRLEF